MIAVKARFDLASLKKVFGYLDQARAFDSYDWPDKFQIRQTIQGWFGDEELDRQTLEWFDEKLRDDRPAELTPDLSRAHQICRETLTLLTAEEALRQMAANADPFRQIGAEGAAQRMEGLKDRGLDDATLTRLAATFRNGGQWMLAACIQYIAAELDKI